MAKDGLFFIGSSRQSEAPRFRVGLGQWSKRMRHVERISRDELLKADLLSEFVLISVAVLAIIFIILVLSHAA